MSTECPVCMNDWSKDSCVPKMLNCGHSYCYECLVQLLVDKQQYKSLQCPTCMQEHKFSSHQDLEAKTATNHSLLQKVEQLKDQKIDNYNLGNMIDDDQDDENFNIELQSQAKCPKHDLAIHSYIKSNKVLLCSRCIIDGKIEKNKFKPITQVVKETRGSMNSFKLKLNQGLLQLKRFKEHIENIKDENRKKCIDSVNNHYK